MLTLALGFHMNILVRVQVEALLASSGVATMYVPATYEAFPTWKGGLGFVDMPPHQKVAAKTFMGLLLFPGTQMLVKTLLPGQETLGLDENGQPIEPAPPAAPPSAKPDESQPASNAGISSTQDQPGEPSKSPEDPDLPSQPVCASEAPMLPPANGLLHLQSAHSPAPEAAAALRKGSSDAGLAVCPAGQQYGQHPSEQQQGTLPSSKRQRVSFADSYDVPMPDAAEFQSRAGPSIDLATSSQPPLGSAEASGNDSQPECNPTAAQAHSDSWQEPNAQHSSASASPGLQDQNGHPPKAPDIHQPQGVHVQHAHQVQHPQQEHEQQSPVQQCPDASTAMQRSNLPPLSAKVSPPTKHQLRLVC